MASVVLDNGQFPAISSTNLVASSATIGAITTQTIVSAGGLSANSFTNTTTPNPIFYTSASIPITGAPPTGPPELISNGYNPTNVVMDLTPLRNFKVIRLRVLSGNYVSNNSNPGQSAAALWWCNLTANPAGGGAFNAEVLQPINVINSTTPGLVVNNGTQYALQTYLPPTSGSAPNADNIISTVFISYPSNGTITLWADALSGANFQWFDSVRIEALGVL